MRPTPAPASPHAQLYEALHNEGLGGKDFSSIFRYRWAGLAG
jgi:hypothetical protein